MTQAGTVSASPQVNSGGRRKTGTTKRRGARIGWIRPISLGRITLWELAVLAVVATGYPLRVNGIVVLSVAAVVVLSTSVRLKGLCIYQWFDVYRKFRIRRSSAAQVRVADPIAAVLPGLRLSRHIDRAGNRTGVAEQGDSWTAVVRLGSTTILDSVPLLSVLRTMYEHGDIRLATAELVTWSVPSPPRARYYGDYRDTQPMRIHWLAVRYRPVEAPLAAAARGGGNDGAARTVSAAAMSLVGRLATAGFDAKVLDEPELRQDLLVALGAGNSGADARIRETWHDWSIGTLRQRCFLPKDRAGEIDALGRWADQAAFTCTSHTLTRDNRERVAGATRIRIGIHPTELQLDDKRVAKALGLRLVSSNGRQDTEVRHTLPLALPTR